MHSVSLNAPEGIWKMLGFDSFALGGVDSVAHIIQVALTPVFLLSGIASLLGVFSGRLARVADRVDALSEQLETADGKARAKVLRRLTHLRRRSHMLDVAVSLGALGGTATCAAALVLFVGSLREKAQAGFLFAAFGIALVCTMGALSAFLVEILLASRGTRDLGRPYPSDSESVEGGDGERVESHVEGAPAT